MDYNRMKIVMDCYDKLPKHLREWIANLDFSLHDDHILRGAEEVYNCREFITKGGKEYYKRGNGQN